MSSQSRHVTALRYGLRCFDTIVIRTECVLALGQGGPLD
jgi:hypothetical protein